MQLDLTQRKDFMKQILLITLCLGLINSVFAAGQKPAANQKIAVNPSKEPDADEALEASLREQYRKKIAEAWYQIQQINEQLATYKFIYWVSEVNTKFDRTDWERLQQEVARLNSLMETAKKTLG